MPNNDTDLTRRFYDRISAACDLPADSGERSARERGLAALAVQPGEHVLEIDVQVDARADWKWFDGRRVGLPPE